MEKPVHSPDITLGLCAGSESIYHFRRPSCSLVGADSRALRGLYLGFLVRRRHCCLQGNCWSISSLADRFSPFCDLFDWRKRGSRKGGDGRRWVCTTPFYLLLLVQTTCDRRTKRTCWLLLNLSTQPTWCKWWWKAPHRRVLNLSNEWPWQYSRAVVTLLLHLLWCVCVTCVTCILAKIRLQWYECRLLDEYEQNYTAGAALNLFLLIHCSLVKDWIVSSGWVISLIKGLSAALFIASLCCSDEGRNKWTTSSKMNEHLISKWQIGDLGAALPH